MPDFVECRRTLSLYLKARVPFISVRTDERDRALELLRQVAAELSVPVYVHTLSHGMRDISTARVVSEDRSVPGALDYASQQMLQRQVEYAAQHGFAERLALLARHGWGTDRPPAEGPDRRPLIHRSRTPGQVRGALRSGADVDAVVDGRTALHVAAFAGDVALVRALLEAGADPTLRDAVHDATPLGWAEYACQGEVAMVLRQATHEPS